jgi:hypothetical protein
MPPRFAYWTIIFGGQATSFRSATRDELLPTFKQIQAKHADAQLRYFARGKLWYSDEEAQAALIRERKEREGRRRHEGDRRGPWKPRDDNGPPRREGWKPRDENRPPGRDEWKPRGDFQKPKASGGKPGADRWKPKGGGVKPEADGKSRGPDWRPGGAHKDPRSRFKVPRDVKRARMAKKFGWKKKKDEDK